MIGQDPTAATSAHDRIDPDALRRGRDTLRLEALGLMTAGIVHDLGNMVQVLSSAMNMLDRHPDVRAADGLAPVVTGAVMSLERATALIRQILGFARAGEAEDEDVDPGLCLAGLERLLRWIAPDDVKLDLRIAGDLGRLRCNRRNFENAVLNLVLNACDAMPRGGRLTIGVVGFEGLQGPWITVSVADTGRGMTAEVLSRAFDPFFTTKPDGQGNGLGLAMVRRFAQETGGSIEAASRPLLGTTITLRLPAAPFGRSAS